MCVTADGRRSEFLDELRMLCKLRHPNIVQSLGVVTQERPLMLLFEYLPKASRPAATSHSSLRNAQRNRRLFAKRSG